MPRLDELGTSGVWLDIEIAGPTDDDGVTPVIIRGIEHASTGKYKTLNCPGRIICVDDVFYDLLEIFGDEGLTTYTNSGPDGTVVRYWELMAKEVSDEEYLRGCRLEPSRPIRYFTYYEVYGDE